MTSKTVPSSLILISSAVKETILRDGWREITVPIIHALIPTSWSREEKEEEGKFSQRVRKKSSKNVNIRPHSNKFLQFFTFSANMTIRRGFPEVSAVCFVSNRNAWCPQQRFRKRFITGPNFLGEEMNSCVI